MRAGHRYSADATDRCAGPHRPGSATWHRRLRKEQASPTTAAAVSGVASRDGGIPPPRCAGTSAPVDPPQPDRNRVAPVLDPAAAHPELAVLRAALARHDWWGCRAVLDAAAPDARSWLLRWATDDGTTGDFAHTVWEADATDSTAAALLALHLIHTGWEIRSGAWAQHVSRDQFARFHDYLRRAKAALIDATARQPQDPALWAARLTTARGLQLGQAETRRRQCGGQSGTRELTVPSRSPQNGLCEAYVSSSAADDAR